MCHLLTAFSLDSQITTEGDKGHTFKQPSFHFIYFILCICTIIRHFIFTPVPALIFFAGKRREIGSPNLGPLNWMHFKDFLLRPKEPLVFYASVSSLNLQSSPTNSKSSKFSYLFHGNETIFTSIRFNHLLPYLVID